LWEHERDHDRGWHNTPQVGTGPLERGGDEEAPKEMKVISPFTLQPVASELYSKGLWRMTSTLVGAPVSKGRLKISLAPPR